MTTGSQEVTLAVLPFFHIYAMTTIMVLGLRTGMKIITLPKFDPEMYIKARAANEQSAKFSQLWRRPLLVKTLPMVRLKF